MRKENLYGMPRAEALELLGAAPSVLVSSTGPDGEPILRELNAACWNGRIWFHGAPAGEKMLTLGRACVVAASETVAEIPSHWTDPERACPATTWFRSVQAHGVLETTGDRATKAAALTALMEKQQPEGGYVPLEHPMYARELDSMLVCSVSLERIDGKAKLGQNRKRENRATVLQKLWERGRPGDPRAIDLVARANGDVFGAPPEGTRFVLAPEAPHARAVAEMLAPTYWNDGLSLDEVAEAHRSSSAWVLLEDEKGVVASARACSDHAKRAWIYDVIVREGRRGEGLGDAVMRLLLDHPAVRRTRTQLLGTRDAAAFYARLGFTDRLPSRPYPVTQMIRVAGTAG